MSFLPVTPPAEARTFRLDLIAEDGVSLDLSSVSDLVGTASITWGADGQTFYAIETDSASTARDIYIFNAPSTWSVAGATSTSRITLTNGGSPEGVSGFTGVQFNKDGTKAFSVAGGVAYSYDLSAPYSGTGSRSRSDTLISGIVNIGSFFFDFDGGVIFYENSNRLYSRVLTLPFDLSTMGPQQTVRTLTPSAAIFEGRTGTRMLVLTGAALEEYAATAYDFSTGALLNSVSASGATTGAVYSGNGRKLHLVAGSTVTQYSVDV